LGLRLDGTGWEKLNWGSYSKVGNELQQKNIWHRSYGPKIKYLLQKMMVTNIYFVIGYCRTQLLAALPYEWQQHSTVEISELALLYLNQFGSPPKGSGRRSLNISTEVKFDKKDHCGQPTEENKLIAQYCKSKVRTECRKCIVLCNYK
jgi:hypothetical protein